MDRDLAGRIAGLLLLVVAVLALPVGAAQAEIYKYKQDGVWHYSDAPPKMMPDSGLEVIEKMSALAPVPTADQPLLLADYPSRNPIEKATAATVAVKTIMGFGIGFFITTQGHIITNRHVIRTSDAQNHENQTIFEQAAQRLEAIEKSLAQENQRLKRFESRLSRLKAAARAETHPRRKQLFQADYEENLRTFLNWQREHQKRYQEHLARQKAFNDQRLSYEYDKSLSDLTRHFTIILADGSEHPVHLVAIGRTHDLALLKLEGFRTPVLGPAPLHDLIQGNPVYAIGSPAQLQNSVTSGVFSGFEKGFVQTNAQIYPGNSGGPLISPNGDVLGINTFKKLTHKFEGLGFAIPIAAVWEEFGDSLP